MNQHEGESTAESPVKAASTDGGNISRRRLLNSAALGVGALALSSHARAEEKSGSEYGRSVSPKPGRVLGANNRILMGIIGSGGMGSDHVERMSQRKDVEFIAVCDIYEGNMKEGIKAAGGKAKGFYEHEKLLEIKEIDGILIASPDHWHERHLIDSVLAGKDVYCEKPMCWSIAEGTNMVKQVRRTDRIVQIGMQRRSTGPIIEAKKIVDSGFLGEVSLVRAQWYWNVGHLPKPEEIKIDGRLDWDRFQQPVPEAKRCAMNPLKWRHWRYFWEYSGGNITDQGTHLMDVIQWFMNDSKPPLAAQEYGAVYQVKGYETPDTFCATFEYPKFMSTFTLTYTNSYQDSWMLIFHGRNGTLEIDDDGAMFYKEPWPQGNWRSKYPKAEHILPGELDMEAHESNFLDCMRTRKDPNAPVEIGHAAVAGLHLANAAHHAKRRAILDHEKMVIRFES